MTGQRSPEERIALWLEEEAVGQLPDRTLEATFARTRAIRNRPGPSIWRLFPMSRPFATLLAVGAAAIVIVVGFNALRPSPAPSVVGASPSPSPAASAVQATPDASPTPFRSLKPLGLAIVGLDGSIRQDLGMPQDAWVTDLAADGHRVALVTSSIDLAECGQCIPNITRTAIVDVGSGQATFFYDDKDLGYQDVIDLAWSPDGKHIAFAATLDGNVDIYVADLGKTDLLTNGVARRLTTDPNVDDVPAWTPDGKTILYANAGAIRLNDSGFSPTQEIWSVPAGGGTPRRLTTNEDPDTQPDVSADGTVAYWHGGDIWTMTTTGARQRPLASVPSQLGFNPRWSPDGKHLAVHVYDPSDRARFLRAGHQEDLPLLKVVVVDLGTGGVSEVGPRVASDYNPVSWMPDGSSLLINRFDDGS